MSLADDIAQAQRELEISGIEEIGVIEDLDDVAGIDEIGAAARLKAAKRILGMPKGKVPGLGDVGPLGVLPLPLTAAVTLAAGAVGNMTFTPNRNVSIRDIFLDTYVAAAAAAARMPAALKVTAITIQGRPQMAGIGEVPITAFGPNAYPRKLPFLLMQNCSSGQNIVISLINNDAATTHIVTGTIWVACAF